MRYSGVVKVTAGDIEVFDKVQELYSKTCRYIENTKDGEYKVKTTNLLMYLMDYSLHEEDIDTLLKVSKAMIGKGTSERCVPDSVFKVWEGFKITFKDFY